MKWKELVAKIDVTKILGVILYLSDYMFRAEYIPMGLA